MLRSSSHIHVAKEIGLSVLRSDLLRRRSLGRGVKDVNEGLFLLLLNRGGRVAVARQRRRLRRLALLFLLFDLWLFNCLCLLLLVLTDLLHFLFFRTAFISI